MVENASLQDCGQSSVDVVLKIMLNGLRETTFGGAVAVFLKNYTNTWAGHFFKRWKECVGCTG